MAMAPPRPCSHPKCATLNCTTHAPKPWQPSDQRQRLVTRIRGRELQRRRALLFARAPWCAGCLLNGRQTRATIRDHIVPLAEGGTEDARNIQGLCLDCSDAKTELESKRGVVRSQLTPRFRKSSTPRDRAGHFSPRRIGWTR
jgi:5-methylcytosine-specific restriction protein A